MTFESRITRAPVPFEPERAEDALRALGWASGPAADLLAGTAGCSPYLGGLMERESEWLAEVMPASPEDTLETVLAGLAQGPAAEVKPALRQAKRRLALLTAMADLGGVWGLDEVTDALTRLADRAVDAALKTALMPELARGKLPGMDEAAIEDAGGLVALAMGKMGAFELNYSSDIDLICLFDDAPFEGADLHEARAVFVKVVRRAMALLSDLTGDGYVFRTDLRLRPDPSVTPVAVTVSAAERYYEALGRTWERAAFVKARPAAGAVAVGARFLEDIRPFIWRRHLDFATVEDAHEIRRKIRTHKQTDPGQGLDGRDVKLGPGGIREIEFFTQTHQLIAGGRDPELRVRGTRAGLRRLSEKGWVTQAAQERLDAVYVRLREIEHRLQMVRDAQTQALPASPEGWTRLAHFDGRTDADETRAEIAAIFDEVHSMTEGFFAPSEPPKSDSPDLPDAALELIEGWQSYPALRSNRARTIFARLKPELLRRFDAAARPEEAIAQFDGFLRGLPAGVQLLSLFEANPQLIDLMVDISSTSPALARYLSAHSGVLDAVIGGDFFAPWPGAEALTAELSERLAREGTDYEAQLDAARRWMKDWHFRIGVHHLRGLIGPDEAAAQYSDLAQSTVAALWDAVCAEFARKHGHVAGRGAVVLGMGSLGARQLSAGSDLDLIVIYDAPEGADSDGRRPLAARSYYARLTKALVTALSAQTAAGTLYEVDMRLRPSGRQGPAAASWASYQNYQLEEAWTWEHLALTRARVMAGSAELGEYLEAFRCRILRAESDIGKVMTDLSDMRDRLAAAKRRRSVWDVTNGPGGLQDIELLAQAMALLGAVSRRRVADQLDNAGGLVEPAEAGQLARAHRLLSAVKACARLLTDGDLDPATIGHGGRQMLVRDTGVESVEALEETIEDTTGRAADIIDAAVAGSAACLDAAETGTAAEGGR